MNTRRNFDKQKRTTIKTLSGLGAGIALASAPVLSSAASMLGSSSSVSLSEDLEITLVSSPDVVENSLIVKNISNAVVNINSFQSNNVFFDGDIIDCNGNCANKTLTLLPGEEKVINVSQMSSQTNNTSAIDYLDAKSAISYLPHGTRIVSLGASVSGNTGHLYCRPLPIAA